MAELVPFTPPPFPALTQTARWGQLFGSARGFLLAQLAASSERPIVVITRDIHETQEIEQEIRFFLGKQPLPLFTLPDLETLAYDWFSPHQDIISQRLESLYRMPEMRQGILLLPIPTLMQRLAPTEYLRQSSFLLQKGDRRHLEQLRADLQQSGYLCVSQVMEHGEFAVRGSLLDLFPMGSAFPYRIDFFDDEVESIRTFDPENQRTLQTIENIRLLPAKEFPLNDASIKLFRQQYREQLEGDPQASVIYREVSRGIAPPGIEYYLPLFFTHTNLVFDYLPKNSLLVQTEDAQGASEQYWKQVQDRYELRRHFLDRPILSAEKVFLSPKEVADAQQAFSRLQLQSAQIPEVASTREQRWNFGSKILPDVALETKAPEPARALCEFVKQFDGKLLFIAESTGRRELLIEMLKRRDIRPTICDDWPSFLASESKIHICVAPLERSFYLPDAGIAILTEAQIFGERAKQDRRRKKSNRDQDAIVRNLTELEIGAPVVHEDHGVGRYLGLELIHVGDIETEYLTLSYAGGDKLYVPVSSLELISRYTGTTPEQAPLHKLGGEQWQKAKRKAAEKVRDVAVELLDLYARRAAKQGKSFKVDPIEYATFCSRFPFEETPDQETAIEKVLEQMASKQPMDLVVCGDVGFGKTEVAMRAAFVAVSNGAQTAVLVPTTLLAQQHYQNFCDRFSEMAVRVAVLSRFRNAKEQADTLQKLADGQIDIVIGTHKLIQKDVKFKNLGLVIVDEEHRFGVRHKEQLKQLRAEVDLLTLTATPIPRTLNMALAGIRDLAIIATPPTQRLSIKTFVSQWNNEIIQEACSREIKRGGQIYFLHNQVETIEKMATDLERILPLAKIGIAHGQMREQILERTMLDFYHHRFNVLLCTTIIESGIDVPNANTIIINRADRLGLAQLHQLRGRVGRSHHRAYAYMIVPERAAMTADAIKRLEAIEALEDLGAGFTLATHDLEIRGAGELLGDEQSGQIQEIGFGLYSDLLEQAVNALKAGKIPNPDQPLDHGPEVDLHIPALLPADYLPDVKSRLILYKRMSAVGSEAELDDLQVEMIDRFGLLPDAAKNLVQVTRMKLVCAKIGIRKLEAGPQGGRLIFQHKPNIDPMKIIRMIQANPKMMKLDGNDKLKFFAPMETPQQRCEWVQKLLLDLSE